MVSNGEPETARLDEAAASYSATYSIPRKERRSSDLASRPNLTGPAWPAGSRGECPPVSACGGSLLLYFAPRAHRPRRARIAGLLESGNSPLFRSCTAVQVGRGGDCPWGRNQGDRQNGM